MAVENFPCADNAHTDHVSRVFTHLNAWMKAACHIEFQPDTEQVAYLSEVDIHVVKGDRPRYRFDVSAAAFAELRPTELREFQLDMQKPIGLTLYPECLSLDASYQGEEGQFEHLDPRLSVALNKVDKAHDVLRETLVLTSRTAHQNECILVRSQETRLPFMDQAIPPRTEMRGPFGPGDAEWISCAEVRMLGSLVTMMYLEDPDLFDFNVAEG
jgi:hypothetical protein